MLWHADRQGRNQHAPAASIGRPASWLTREPWFWCSVHRVPDRSAQRRAMLDTLFVLCRDADSRSWLRPETRQWGAMGTAGGFQSATASTSRQGVRGPVEKLASRAMERPRTLRLSGRWRRLRGAVVVHAALNLRSAPPSFAAMRPREGP